MDAQTAENETTKMEAQVYVFKDKEELYGTWTFSEYLEGSFLY